MRFLAHIVTLTIAIIVIWFAITNRHQVDLTFDPLPLSLSLPFYLPVFAGVLLGLVAGGVISWRTGRTRRARLRAAERERDELQHNLDRPAPKDR
jgi:lipopolysaccharide assembly protein A